MSPLPTNPSEEARDVSVFQIFSENAPHSEEWRPCITRLLSANDHAESEVVLDVIHRLIALATLKDDEKALSEVMTILQRHGLSPQVRLAAISQWDDYQVERLSRFLATDFQTEDFHGLEPLVNELVRSALLKDKHSFPLILTLLDDLETQDRRFPAVIAGIHFVMSQKRWKPPHLPELPKTLQRNDFPLLLGRILYRSSLHPNDRFLESRLQRLQYFFGVFRPF